MMTNGVVNEAARLYDQMNESACVLRSGQRANLQELLSNYGVPDAPGRLAKSQSTLVESHIRRVVDPQMEQGNNHPPARFETIFATNGNHEIAERQGLMSAASSCGKEAALTADLWRLLQDPHVSRVLAANDFPKLGESCKIPEPAFSQTDAELLSDGHPAFSQTDAELIFDGQKFGQTCMRITGGHQKDLLPSLEDVGEDGFCKETL
jgi:hypothetical protein